VCGVVFGLDSHRAAVIARFQRLQLRQGCASQPLLMAICAAARPLSQTQGANDALSQGRSFYSLSLEFTEDVSGSKVSGGDVNASAAGGGGCVCL